MKKLEKEELSQKYTELTQGKASPLLYLYGLIIKGFSASEKILTKLTLPQKLYLVASFLILSDSSLGLAAIITVIALTLEFWPLFDRVWNSLAGKTVLLLFYAIIANFAIAGAASVVNEVVGVSSLHLSYTHNFAILLYLPAWGIAVSATALLILQVIVPVYLIFLLLLKPFGVKGIQLLNHTHYKFTTMFLRLILAMVVLYHLALIVNVDKFLTEDLAIPESAEINKLKEDQSVIMKDLDSEDIKIANANINFSLDDTQQDIEEDTSYDDVRENYEFFVRELIAEFAYSLESDSRSRCYITPGSNVIELNDYEILEIAPDDNQAYGFSFIVKKCISPAFK